MNLYLVSRSECNYDEFSDFVVAAASGDEALSFIERHYNDPEHAYGNWPNVGEKTARLIGTTNLYKETTNILGSFHAG